MNMNIPVGPELQEFDKEEGKEPVEIQEEPTEIKGEFQSPSA